jgi:hypothetical protein
VVLRLDGPEEHASLYSISPFSINLQG